VSSAITQNRVHLDQHREKMTGIDLPDARKTKRRHVLDVGLIRLGYMSICCVLRNLSEAGAALDVGSRANIPDQFTLIVVRSKKIQQRCLAQRSTHRRRVLLSALPHRMAARSNEAPSPDCQLERNLRAQIEAFQHLAVLSAG
jgi:hypothetical protein